MTDRDKSPVRKGRTLHCEKCLLITRDNLAERVDKAFDDCFPQKQIPVLRDNPAVFENVAKMLTSEELVQTYDSLLAQKREIITVLQNRLTIDKTNLSPSDATKSAVLFLNGAAHFGALKPGKMTLLPLREFLRDFHLTYITAFPNWSGELNPFVQLHPRRRKLWHPYEYTQLCLQDPDVECKHCQMLEAQYFRDKYSVPITHNMMDYFWINEDLPDIDEDDVLENFDKQPIQLQSIVDHSEGFGDDPDYYPTLAIQDFSLQSGTVCWRFLKTECTFCGYRVLPSPVKDRHCLACYFFRDVLNELTASLTSLICRLKSCLEDPWNATVKQWPHRRIEKL